MAPIKNLEPNHRFRRCFRLGKAKNAELALSGLGGSARRLVPSVERQPDYIAGTVTAVAMSRLGESVGQLPLLRFVTPLCGRMRDDVVRLAVTADGGGPPPLPTKDNARLLVRTEWIEK